MAELLDKLSAKALKRLKDLWARMWDPGSASAEVAKAAEQIRELLKRNGLGHLDVRKVMHAIEQEERDADTVSISV
jgi:hypothetical protein